MASKRARAILAAYGMESAHSGLEKRNFATGTGLGRFALPYHVVVIHAISGDSKTTIGSYKTLDTARAIARNVRASYADRTAHAVYIRDIRTDDIYRL